MAEVQLTHELGQAKGPASGRRWSERTLIIEILLMLGGHSSMQDELKQD